MKVLATFAKPQALGEPGLPKHSISEAIITVDGVEGDFNAYRRRKFQNTPDRALLILPIEILQKLQVEGYPVQPGHLGENITTQGIAYNDLSPGKRYQAGSVIFEITEPCTPCRNLRTLPYGTAEFVQSLIGRRGWYAKVLQEGMVHAGDSMEEL